MACDDVRRQMAELAYEVDNDDELLAAVIQCYGMTEGQAEHFLAGSPGCLVQVDDEEARS